MSKKKPCRILHIEYNGYNPDFDEDIRKCLRRYSDASGFGFGTRDIKYYYKDSDSAKKAAKKLREKFKKRLRIRYYNEPTNKEY